MEKKIEDLISSKDELLAAMISNISHRTVVTLWIRKNVVKKQKELLGR